MKTPHLLSTPTFLAILFLAAIILPTGAFAQIQLPNRPAKIEAAQVITMIEPDGRFHLKVNYLNNFHLNNKVPAEKRITLTIPSLSKNYSDSQFIQSNKGADLFFTHETNVSSPLTGSLKIYLCRADQCQIVRKEVTWEPQKNK